MNKRTPREVIDQAIREGRPGLWLAYVSIVVSLCGGVFGLLEASRNQQPLVAVLGGLLSTCIWPSMQHALKVRHQNVALRLLEIPLNQAQSSAEMAKLLQDFFREAYFRTSGGPTS